MTEPPSRPKVSKRVTPLAVIIVVIAVGLVILAVVRAGRHVEPLNDSAPIAAPENTETPNATTPNAETSKSTDL
jgi:hypothetical protein